MSFYFDDFDDVGGETQGTQQSSQGLPGLGEEQEFLCANCGGRESYEENGLLVCANCFTQSQERVYEKDTTMAFEDIMAVAARTKGGRLVASELNKKKKTTGAHSNQKVKQPLEELDKSKPLPDLKMCIHGFTEVLKAGVERLCCLMGLGPGEKRVLMESVKRLWMTYLRAWSDAAETYGPKYPDIRFSLRDYFISGAVRSRIMRVLSYRAAQKAKEQLAEQEDKLGNDADSDDDDDDGDDDDGDGDDGDDDGDDDDSTVAASGSQQLASYPNEHMKGDNDLRKQATLPPILHESSNYNTNSAALPNIQQPSRKRKRGFRNLNDLLRRGIAKSHTVMNRETAALCLYPSMDLVAAILWFAIARIGILPGQLVNWIANGTLPLMNAFERMLTKDDQESLLFLCTFFRMARPPKPTKIEKLAALLSVVCGMKESKEVPQHWGLVRIIENTDGPTERIRKVVDRLRFVSVKNVPLMIGQLVADLRLGQRVLDIALSLVGTKPLGRVTDPWLPRPLSRTDPERVSTPEYALAVIVVACKMCPDWETWSYVKASPVGDKSDSSPKQRFAPWNVEQFSLLNDGDVSDYLDFYEDIILVRKDKQNDPGTIQGFSRLLDKACERKKKEAVKGDELPADNLLNSQDTDDETDNAAQNEEESISVQQILPRTSNEKHRDLLSRHPRNLIPYLSYPNRGQHTRVKQANLPLTPEPFHGFYVRLIEYVSYKVRVHPHRIHEIVSFIDEEIVELCEKGEFKDPEISREFKLHKGRQARARSREERENPNWATLALREMELQALQEKTETEHESVEKKQRLKELKQHFQELKSAKAREIAGMKAREESGEELRPLAAFSLPDAGTEDEDSWEEFDGQTAEV